jgi:hypothetical protein
MTARSGSRGETTSRGEGPAVEIQPPQPAGGGKRRRRPSAVAGPRDVERRRVKGPKAKWLRVRVFIGRQRAGVRGGVVPGHVSVGLWCCKDLPLYLAR